MRKPPIRMIELSAPRPSEEFAPMSVEEYNEWGIIALRYLNAYFRLRVISHSEASSAWARISAHSRLEILSDYQEYGGLDYLKDVH